MLPGLGGSDTEVTSGLPWEFLSWGGGLGDKKSIPWKSHYRQDSGPVTAKEPGASHPQLDSADLVASGGP